MALIHAYGIRSVRFTDLAIITLCTKKSRMELSLPTYLMPELFPGIISNLISNSALSNVDFSLSLNNFFTFTSYSGMDPETPGATYPISRSVMFSVNVGF